MKKFTKPSIAGALGALIIWALSTFAFNGQVPVAVQTAVPLVAAYVAGVVVPHLPKDFFSDNEEDNSTE